MNEHRGRLCTGNRTQQCAYVAGTTLRDRLYPGSEWLSNLPKVTQHERGI